MRPVLTPGEWAECERMATPATEDHAELLRMAVAISMAQLPDGDPLKFTREHVALLRQAAADVPDGYRAINRIADIIEAILPPITRTEH